MPVHLYMKVSLCYRTDIYTDVEQVRIISILMVESQSSIIAMSYCESKFSFGRATVDSL
jgi:hypothetical protein